MAKKQRLDTLLVERGLFPSREQAQRAILAGWVKVAQSPAHKAGTPTDPEAAIEVRHPGVRYASRGGHKLAHALATFGLPVRDRVCLDVGASTGGFTDVLLKAGARMVHAVDVGYGQLAWELRQDPRVHVMERTNVRYLESPALGEPVPDLAVIDVSFIGLAKVLPAVQRLLRAPGTVVALIKPQFEAGPKLVGKGGVVRDPAVHRQVLEAVLGAAEALGWHAWHLAPSPIRGPEGNLEFLVEWRQEAPPQALPPLETLVEAAHREVP